MNYYDRIQKSIDFIEENLTSQITLEQVSQKAYCSLSYFHQVFHAVLGYSVKEYIRKRRLSEAAKDLINTNSRVLNISLKYQYQTAESFTRAFNKMFNLTPIQYRKCGEHKNLLEKANLIYSFSNVEGGIFMEPRIIVKDEFKVIGVEVRTSFDNPDYCIKIKKLWQKFNNENILEKIPNKIYENTCLGMTCDFDGEGNFSYIICAEVDEGEEAPKGMVEKIIPVSKYAVFTVCGEEHYELGEKLGKLWNYIYTTWLPDSGYEQPGSGLTKSCFDYTETSAADFELYDERFTDTSFEVDVYVPIK